jgi:hypothetical protein
MPNPSAPIPVPACEFCGRPINRQFNLFWRIKMGIVLGVQEVKYACMYLPLSEPSKDTYIKEPEIGKCKKFLEAQHITNLIERREEIKTEAAHG